MKENMVGRSLHNFDFLKIIGEGAWAQVYIAINNNDGREVAIKAVPKQKIKEVPKLEELVKTEIKVLRECKNENVIRFVDTFTTDKTIFIGTEFCNGGDMEEYLMKKKTLTEDEATMFLKHMLNGFKGLHEVGAMHRDFKLANVLLHNGVAKIADLGFAKQMVKGLTRTILGTSLTMAPEVLQERPYNNTADIWSLGVVYYQMLYGKYPYNGKSDGEILRKIKQNRPDYKSVRISDNCRDFIDKCLTQDPQKRISWQQIYEHSLIKKNQKNVNFLYGNDAPHLSENKNFYKEEKKQTKKFMFYPELSDEYDVSDVDFNQVQDIRATINYDAKLKIAEQKKEMEEAFGRYSKQYLMKRNDIMFVFKYIAPYIFGLYQIKANHEISMFIISKKAYLDMRQFIEYITKRSNYFKLNRYWEQFTMSPQYKNIEDQVKNDLDLIYSQCISYREEIAICNQQIEAEKNIEKVSSKNFIGLVNETVDGYWFLLAEALGRFNGEKKQILIKVLQALEYFKGASKTNVEQFDRMMLHTDMKDAENTINSKIQSIFN